jgi:hypothetical protein
MLDIPSITKEQLVIVRIMLKEHSLGIHHRFWARPQIELDPLDNFVCTTEAHQDLDALITLGLIKDVTEAHKETLAPLEEHHKHTFRVIELTKLAHQMFSTEDFFYEVN